MLDDEMFDTCPSCGLSKNLPHVVNGLRKKKEQAERERDEALSDLAAQDHIIARLKNEKKELQKRLIAVDEPIRFGPNSYTKRQEVTLNFYDEEPAGP